MDVSNLIESLSNSERVVLRSIVDGALLSDLVTKTGLSQVQVMRALQWLENKKILSLSQVQCELVKLDENGFTYANEGLPEKRLLKKIAKKEISLSKLKEASGLDPQEFNVSLGMLKGKAAINIDKGMLSITSQGEKLLSKETLEEKFLHELFQSPIQMQAILDEQKFALDNLKKRKKILHVSVQKDWDVSITELGKKLQEEGISEEEFIESLNPKIISEGSWEGKKFKRYDVSINVPRIDGGKRHFVYQAVDYAKRIWLDMGFTEMTGNLLDTSFWVFDALFTAQDHPVREMQDTFFIEDPERGNLPDKELYETVKKAHESGLDNSKGWRYSWDPEEAKRNVMRTHTTILSAQTLATLRNLKDLKPAKYFAVGRNFRNETVDWSHLFEFNQTEGIVVDPNANFRNLLGYLKEFFKKMGYPDARFRPAFFSYTEPSVEIDIFHPVHKKWIEFGGAGIFRPEVVIPLLGKDIPVLAWGPGFDRIYLEYYDINDIRELYKNDLKQLRDAKFWLK